MGGKRAARSKGVLSKERERLLTVLPGWTWNSRAGQWDRFYALLQQFVKANGSARVPGSFELDGYKLGVWVVSQRAKFKQGALNAERVRRLSEIPGWSWDPFAAQWEDGFSKLVEYSERHGHALVPRSYLIDGFNLGGWVQKQRSVFNRGGGDPERRASLQALPGWTWQAKRTAG